MLAKKRSRCCLELQQAMQRNQVEKRYQALVKGSVAQGQGDY